MKIGIDVDDTITNTTESFLNIMDKYGINKEIYFRKFDDPERLDFLNKYHDEVIENATIKEDAITALNELKKLGHTIVIITARSKDFGNKSIKNTQELVKKYNLPIDKIYFHQPNKYQLCKDIGLDIMIDDSVWVCGNLEKEHIDYLMFDSATNQDSTLKRVMNWEDVLKYIKNKTNN